MGLLLLVFVVVVFFGGVKEDGCTALKKKKKFLISRSAKAEAVLVGVESRGRTAMVVGLVWPGTPCS